MILLGSEDMILGGARIPRRLLRCNDMLVLHVQYATHVKKAAQGRTLLALS